MNAQYASEVHLIDHFGLFPYLQALASEVLYTVKYFVVIMLKGAVLLTLVSGFVWLSWRLIQQNSIQNCLFLCYP